jgi:hypothetical protein
VGGLRREDGRVPRCRRPVVHGITIAVQRVKARVREPGLVEVNSGDALAQELDHPIGAIAQTVIGRVRDDCVHRRLLGGVASKRASGHCIGDRLGRQPGRGDGTDDPIAVARRHEVDRDRVGDRQGVVDRLVTVAVRQHDVTGHDAGMRDDLVRGRGPVQHEVGRIGAEDSRRVLLRFVHHP